MSKKATPATPARAKTEPKPVTRAAASGRTQGGFNEDERAAMHDRVEELKAAARRRAGGGPEDEEREVAAKIAAMSESDRVMAERLHKVIKAAASVLTARLWYGMPAYARDGKVICFFQPAQRFKTRYATLGFSDAAKLDDGAMWPNSFALQELTPAAEAQIRALIKKAVT